MTKDVPCDRAEGLVVEGWKSGEEGLLLRVKGDPEEVRIQCVCCRCHWIVREQLLPEGPRLLVTCHNCGRRGVFALETADLSAR